MCDIWIKDFKFDNLASTYVAQKKTQLLLKEFAKTEDVKLECDVQIYVCEAYECEKLRKYTEAEKKYKKAIKIREKQLKNITITNTDNKSKCFEYQKDIANWHNKLATLEKIYLKRYQLALKNYKKAIESIDKIINNKEKAFDYNLNVTFTFANTYLNYADLLVYQLDDDTSAKENVLKDYKAAEENYKNAIEILEKYPKNTEDDHFFLAQTYISLANLQNNDLKDYKSAEGNYMKAIEYLENHPKDSENNLYTLATTYYLLANVQYIDLDENESAQSYYEKAEEILIKLPKDNQEYQSTLAYVYRVYAILLTDVKYKHNLAQDYYNNAINIRKIISKDDLLEQYALANEYDLLAKLQHYNLSSIIHRPKITTKTL